MRNPHARTVPTIRPNAVDIYVLLYTYIRHSRSLFEIGFVVVTPAGVFTANTESNVDRHQVTYNKICIHCTILASNYYELTRHIQYVSYSVSEREIVVL